MARSCAASEKPAGFQAGQDLGPSVTRFEDARALVRYENGHANGYLPFSWASGRSQEPEVGRCHHKSRFLYYQWALTGYKRIHIFE